MAFCHHTYTAPSHARRSPLAFSPVTDTAPSSLASPDARRLDYTQHKSPLHNPQHGPNAPARP
ncbi:hypothetical protein POSPLADRAFT_1039977 [Postia placenta MAD-698-R-SB12]|uniref:Uncharacterized protein n=1 Tax=Postia placenta MAD-698-R-SB12 TaxID=670580 RepID=A0A1X6N0S0_9APHY|nr:hypothetical protein POSPLADRAFT_1039977 [Postia placenta MAD-698-R-SB12]OSX62218.1 hypothetical protein POSPLADRAFT_1039977 [Postia placenta MAD-698-R-SB12]